MKWVNKEADIYFCSNCEIVIRVPDGEELPCYCKNCEMDYNEEGYDISYEEYRTLKERVENKLTLQELTQALECCGEENKCQQCPYYNKGNFKCLNYKFFKDLLDLINSQQETIETLRKCVEQHHIIRKDGKSPLSLLTAEIRAEAIKEFAEDTHEEIRKALDNNYKVRNQRIERNLTEKRAETCDDVVHYAEGKIDALRGIDGFVCDYVIEKVGEQE